jgi:hypothetical protein
MANYRQLQSKYPGFDVLDEKDAWDSHTQEVVSNRLRTDAKYQFFTIYEAQMIRTIAQNIVYDDREEILQYIADNFDGQIASKIGEGQREPGVPPEDILVREGLKAIDVLSEQLYVMRFVQLNPEEQTALLEKIEKGMAEPVPQWAIVPQKPFFKKLLNGIVKPYYSHPAVWSEIGYAGPAYPRGYVRSEYGLTDPWEARRDDA